MTVCIAAICEQNTDDPKIILCSDTKLSGKLGSTHMVKNRVLRPDRGGWYCLISGDDGEALTTFRLLRHEFMAASQVDETNVLAITQSALNKRKVEKANELIQGKFGISYSEFLSTGKVRLPDDLFRNSVVEVELTQIDVEFVIAGYDDSNLPMLVETNGTKAVLREDFAVCGQGASLAQAILMNRKHNSLHKFGRALYAVFEAKKFAEAVPSVGDTTLLNVVHRDGKYQGLKWDGIVSLNEHHNTLGLKPVPDDLIFGDEIFQTMTHGFVAR